MEQSRRNRMERRTIPYNSSREGRDRTYSGTSDEIEKGIEPEIDADHGRKSCWPTSS